MKYFFALSLAAAVSAAPTAITPRTDAPFGIKKGLAYNNGAITNVLSTSGSATWAYNWGTASNAPKFQYVKRCHCCRSYESRALSGALLFKLLKLSTGSHTNLL
jgi:hypothetical protein